MKTLIKFYAVLFTLLTSLAFYPFASTFTITSETNNEENDSGITERTEEVSRQIRLALLLDTSNSMDGLIDQAKAQLWNIVDELANAESEGQAAELFIALYEYGNDNLSIRSNFIRQVSPFTQDLDEISKQLFALTTRGGSEYCGAVIGTSMDQLNWNDSPEDLRMIYIAGNEPFNQGGIDYKSTCATATQRDIQINTIFCGNYQEGIDTHWLDGAKIGKGNYLNIDMDQKTVFVATPYDKQIDQLNDDLNDTYLVYGKEGKSKKEMQLRQDSNAESYSRANKVKRAISKSKHVYKNDSWDLVDASKEDDFDLTKLKIEELPDEMKNMDLEQRKSYIRVKSKERADKQSQIQELAAKRKLYIKQVNDSLNVENPLEEAILRTVKESAATKNFSFKE